MPPPPHTKPENVLKRAQELIAVGQSQAALNILHEHVTSKRSRNSPIQSLEPVMILFLELCVDLKKGKHAKDGLYQYKNTAQNTNVGTIELVLNKFIDLSEAKVTEAQAKAQEIQASQEPSATGTPDVDDLDATNTPESIMLSIVSGDQASDRTDRAIVTPWLKFLWETYRTVLEILKNNARLEIMYQTTALQAFGFCQRYARKTEFRRLCELLRNHLQNAAKYQSQMHAINLSDPDTLQRHLDTRFSQLNVAAELELWQEAFRSVEDIHNLLTLSKRHPKNIMMANYYEKLTRIFMRSENYHFHAAAQNRYYKLMRQSAAAIAAGQSKKDNPAVTEADLTRAASFVLLSSLAIPVISTSRSRGALLDADEARRSKNTRLTNLLNMAQAPTRGLLFKDALNMGLLKRVKPEIRELYQILEVDFHPLSICKRISPILTQIGADPEMAKYIEPLQQVILTRLFQQLSQVYESVELGFVYDLAQFPEPYQKDAGFIEKFIMNGCKKGDFAIRLDHASGVLTFDSDVFSSAKALHPSSTSDNETGAVQRLQSTPAEIVRSQLTRLAKTLYITCQYVDPSLNAQRQAEKKAANTRALAGAEQEHTAILGRRAVIEKKKELATDAAQKKLKEEENRKRFQQQELLAREAERLRAEQELRDKRRREDEAKKVKQENLAKEIDELKKTAKGFDLGEINIDDLDSDRLRQIKLEHLAKEKNELQSMTKITAKRIDHLERAFRKEELKHLPNDYESQRTKDLAVYEQAKTETLEAKKTKHREAVALKNRLTRLLPVYDQFRRDLQEKRHDEFERRRRKADKELDEAIKARKREVREKKAREKRLAEEAERLQREEEERARVEEEERAAKEADEERKKEEIKATRMREREEAAEKARLQAAREEEAVARRAAAKRDAAPLTERTLSRTEEPTSTRPVLNLAGSKPSWREREAARAQGRSNDDAPAAPTPEPSKSRSAYRPPQQKEGGETASTERWRPRPRGEAAPAAGREGSGSARDGSPANSEQTGSKWVPRHLRPDAQASSQRSESGSGRDASKPPGSTERYVPPSRR